jgi:hypothetical protein
MTKLIDMLGIAKPCPLPLTTFDQIYLETDRSKKYMLENARFREVLFERI